MTNTPAVSVDNWETRVQKAAEILGLTTEDVEQGLLSDSIGIEKQPIGLEMLSDETVFRFTDFSNTFGPSGKGIKMGKIRMAYQILIGSKNTNKVKATDMDPRMVMLKERYGIKGDIKMLTTDELLRTYDPRLASDPITVELKARLGDAKVVVFDPETQEVDQEYTEGLITDFERGFEIPTEHMVDGILVRSYAIGEVPDRIYEEDPLVRGAVLRRGRSDKTRIDWTNIGYELRQFCRVCVDTDAVDIDVRREVIHLMTAVRKGVDALSEMYPETALLYREMKEIGTLPSLKLRDTNRDNQHGVNNPFGIGSNRKH